LNPAQTMIVTVSVRVGAIGTITTTATAIHGGIDPNPANNTNSAVTIRSK
jgi:hypothetical protein